MVETFIWVLCGLQFTFTQKFEPCQSLVDWLQISVQQTKVQRGMDSLLVPSKVAVLPYGPLEEAPQDF